MPSRETVINTEFLVWLAVSLQETTESPPQAAPAKPKNRKISSNQQICQAIAEIIKKDGELTFKNFGSFTLRKRSARTGCNPRTGELIEIPASYNLAFKPSTALKEYVTGKEMPTIGISQTFISYFPKEQQNAKYDKIRGFWKNIAEQIVHNEKYYIQGLGSFAIKTRQERHGRNPQTGEKLVIEAATTISFTPDKRMKEAIQ